MVQGYTMNMKKCMLIICFLSSFSHIDAGWRDQWIWFKSLFSGFSIKKPILTRKQVVIGGVGALAVAGAAWWWLKSPKKPTNKSKNPNATLRRSQKKPLLKKSINNPKLLQQAQNLGPSIELTINQPEEINDGDSVFIDFSENFMYSDYKNIFGIVQKTDKGFEVETILNMKLKLNYEVKNVEKLIKADNSRFKKVTLQNINNDYLIKMNEGQYVFVNHQLDTDQEVILIGQYISHKDNEVTVLSGSLFYNVELQERNYSIKDVFVPMTEEEKKQIVESDVNKERLIKEEEKKRIKLAQIESELEAAKREKLKLESELETEKRIFSMKEAKNIIKQTYELKNFEKLLTEYEKNKNKETKTKLTEEFEKLKSNILEDGEELWESFTERYNNAIGLESE